MEKIVSVTSNGDVKQTELTLPKNFDWREIEKASTGINVAPQYFEFQNIGESLRGIYLGTSYVEKNEGNITKKIPVVILATQKGIVMNGGVSLYDTITKFCRVGEALEIVYTGQRKTSNGGYLKLYNITPLII